MPGGGPDGGVAAARRDATRGDVVGRLPAWPGGRGAAILSNERRRACGAEGAGGSAGGIGGRETGGVGLPIGLLGGVGVRCRDGRDGAGAGGGAAAGAGARGAAGGMMGASSASGEREELPEEVDSLSPRRFFFPDFLSSWRVLRGRSQKSSLSDSASFLGI